MPYLPRGHHLVALLACLLVLLIGTWQMLPVDAPSATASARTPHRQPRLSHAPRRRSSLKKSHAPHHRAVWPPPFTVHDTGRTSSLAKLHTHPVGDVFGVGAYIAQRSAGIGQLVVRRAHLMGARWVREEFTASRLHNGPGRPYHWRAYDRVVNQERRAGLQVLGLLDYGNTWNSPCHCVMLHRTMPRLSADFARYASAVVRHFRGRITYWEVWNEPDLTTFWRPRPNADDYAVLLRAAYHAIKRAEPRARVVVAGTSGVDLTFLQRVAARAPFDILSVHPYRAAPEGRLLGQIAALRALHRPIWFSEIGWAAGRHCALCLSQEGQANYLVRFYSLAVAAGVQRIFWYDLRDDRARTTSDEAHFGLLQKDLAGKRAFAAYQVLDRLLRGATFMHPIVLGKQGLYTLRFRSPRGALLIAWALGPHPRTISLPWPASVASVLHVGGSRTAVIPAWAHRLRLTVPGGGQPIYVVDGAPVGAGSLPRALLHPAVHAHHHAHHPAHRRAHAGTHRRHARRKAHRHPAKRHRHSTRPHRSQRHPSRRIHHHVPAHHKRPHPHHTRPHHPTSRPHRQPTRPVSTAAAVRTATPSPTDTPTATPTAQSTVTPSSG